jgi:acyl-lipid omega-6 desaturase (Delta-12 desaturase)
MVIASIVGVWLFSVQHRFEHAQWMRDASWGFAAASLGGTSYLRLPRLLQWFTGNIGFHHVHHVDPRIPNYRLEECHYADAGFQLVSTLTLRTALLAEDPATGVAAEWTHAPARVTPRRGHS